MDWLGVASLVVATSAGLALALRPGARMAAAAGLIGYWGALIQLGWRFVTVDLRYVSVASLSRDELPWQLRLAGVWAGSAGSALFWTTLVVSVLALATRTPRSDAYVPTIETGRRILGFTMLAAGVSLLLIAQPFERSAEPAVRGIGLNPVLEHWAMAVHPPLLYLAQATVLGAVLREYCRDDPKRRWVKLAAALLVSATLLGSWWAHDELGWGGFWAWDPVENTALAPLVAIVASLHSRRRHNAVRWTRVAATSVLAGIAVTRSGLPSSVHAFATGGAMALPFAVAAGLVATSVVFVRRETQNSEIVTRGGHTGRVVASAVTSFAATWILVVVGSAALAGMWLGTRDPVGAVDGRRLGTLLVPAGIAVLCGLLVFGLRRNQRTASVVAHLGALLFAVGVIGSLFGTTEISRVGFNSPADINGHRIVLEDTRIDESRADRTLVDVTASIDGQRTTTSLIDYPDIDRTRARPARIVDVTGETELVVTMLDSDGALVEVRRHPALPYVWVGGALMAAAFALSAMGSSRHPHSESPAPGLCLSRFAASSDPSVEPSSGPTDPGDDEGALSVTSGVE